MKYRVYNIEYDIEPEDLELDEDDYALRSDYLQDCENEIDKILEDLPDEMYLELDEEDVEEDDLNDYLCDAISDATGWLVKRFDFEKVDNGTKKYLLTFSPYCTVYGYLDIPADVIESGEVKNYIYEHFNEIDMEEPELDFAGTDFDYEEEVD